METVLVTGAGIIGLSLALELATRGLAVTVLERGLAMQEASWAAAGMLAANDPENPPLLAPLSRFSLSLYPDFLAQVEQLSGCKIPLRTSATLQVSRPRHTPRNAPRLSYEEALLRVPGLASDIEGDLLWLEESSIDPRDLCKALPSAARAAGVRIVENCRVDSIDVEGDGVRASASPGGVVRNYRADALVVCSGAWSRYTVASATEAIDLNPCQPRKGQMLAVRMPQVEGAPRLETVLRSSEVYLVPRGRDAGAGDGSAGRIIVGATVEDRGFDRSIRPDATAWLMEKASALWPPVRSAQIEDVWTGIRPATADGLPWIGPVPSASSQRSRVWLATGHYRNGILLAPGTARALASAMLGSDAGHSPIDLKPFRPSRLLETGYGAQAPGMPGALLETEDALP